MNPVSPDGRSILLARPDGRWLNLALVVLPLAGDPAEEAKGVRPGDIPARWAADGRSIYVFNRDGVPAQLDRIDVATGERTPVRIIAPTRTASPESDPWC